MRSIMWFAVAAVLAFAVVSPATVAAQPVFGISITAGTDSQTGDGGFKGGGAGAWIAYAWGPLYTGGEIQLETYTRGPGDISTSYHAVVGARARLSARFTVLGDAGFGVSAQTRVPGILDDDKQVRALAWAPSAALRVQLLALLGTTGETRWSLGLASDARSSIDGDTRGVGIGVGLVVDR
jgi:hypothetical protein